MTTYGTHTNIWVWFFIVLPIQYHKSAHTFQTVPAWNTPLVFQPHGVLKVLATAPPGILNILDPAARPGAPLGNQLPTTIRHQDNSSQFLNNSW